MGRLRSGQQSIGGRVRSDRGQRAGQLLGPLLALEPTSVVSTRTDVHIDIRVLLPSWQRSLRAARRSPRRSSPIPKPSSCRTPSSARGCRRLSTRSAASTSSRSEPGLPVPSGDRSASRSGHCSRCSKWMLDEGEITASPMEQMRSPSIPEDPPHVLTRRRAPGVAHGVRGPGLRRPARHRDRQNVHRHRGEVVRMAGLRLEEVTSTTRR